MCMINFHNNICLLESTAYEHAAVNCVEIRFMQTVYYSIGKCIESGSFILNVEMLIGHS